MKTNSYFPTIICSLVFSTVSSHAATLQINWSTNPAYADLDNKTFAPLSNGTNAAGDGTFLQLGYYSLATQSSPFSGSWVNLASSTMGDDGIELPGQFAVTTILNAGAFAAPLVGTPLTVRFFDGTSIVNSIYYNAVSVTSGAWNFVAPSDPAPVINIVIEKQTGIVFLGSAISAYSTQVPIPEPTATLLFAATAAVASMRRRRKRH